MEVVFYGKRKNPVLEFITKLQPNEQAKILACLKSVEELGVYSPRVRFKQISKKLWEIKIQSSKISIRIFYVVISKHTMILLHAYKKQSQKAPKKELDIAITRMQEVLKNESFYTRSSNSATAKKQEISYLL